MTDAHCHLISGCSRHFICGETPIGENDIRFIGHHPWDSSSYDDKAKDALRSRLAANTKLGVGEIGLDRLHSRIIPTAMREALSDQLDAASSFSRPVVLHGAKCWGEVVKACRPFAGSIPAFLFHGFSRSDGLIPDIASINGFISIGPSLLNDHAVNYRSLAKKIPLEMVLLETDKTAETPPDAPGISEILVKLSQIRSLEIDELKEAIKRNAERFISSLQGDAQ
jgi:TatD DNase family protein